MLKERTSSFYSTFISLPTSLFNEDVQFDVIYKKVFFIVLSLLSEFRCALLLTEALEIFFDFLIMPINKWKLQSTHFWIFDTFMEDDDLLFGVMLAFLKIYCCLRKEDLRFGKNNPLVDMLRSELNPHKIFIKFLQQIGNDHSELLSFLVSDETCCLLYLLQYLKLLLVEWELFIEAHEIFFKFKGTTPSSSISKCVINTSLSSSCENKLVSYSCSSSSDEEYPNATVISLKNDKSLRRLSLRTISILMHLKSGIQKLVDVNEFPYNISPLIALLKLCEEKNL
ncbi:lines-like protein 1 [Trichonephila inaurata madagascariensis]|uniref:Lines-like protein 1 n=1 Tax=Trichonephila inaurata madagascariensis TaxID=2747483 RepID=A0A8X6YGF5_9ARAC|nr:lines-like protein 1 [Trichonephila inaurata madagascariensis]